jgi:UDP-N-acetylglucosamine transferase subunit ALG13
MILVVLGTWGMPFVRPLLEIESAARKGLLEQPILVQSGHTSYASPQLSLVPFLGNKELEQKYQEASLVICQAGVGSIMMGLKRQKKIICIARRATYNEHIDDHQLEILRVFSSLGAILPWNGEGDLSEVLIRAKSFVPVEYSFSEERISASILHFLRTHSRTLQTP